MAFHGQPRRSFPGSGFGGRAFPPAVKMLVIANAAVFLLENSPIGGSLVDVCVFSPVDATLRLRLWQFATYMFLHFDLWHLFVNMFTLWMFGRRLEDRWGTPEFLRFYLTCGVGAAVVDTALTPVAIFFGQPPQAMLGASGAIYGVLLGYAYYWSEETVYLNLIFPIKVKYLVLIMGVLDFFGSVGQLAGTDRSSIAHFAHLGGLLTAWLYLRSGGWTGLKSWGRRAGQPRRGADAQRRPFFDDDTWR